MVQQVLQQGAERLEVGSVEEMGAPWSRCNRSQLLEINARRNADREDFNPGLFRQICFQNQSCVLFVPFPVRYQYEDCRNVGTSAVSRREHSYTSSSESGGNVRVTAFRTEVSDDLYNVLLVAICIHVELNIDSVAEQKTADLREYPRYGKRPDNPGGESEHTAVPVVVPIPTGYDTG